MRIIVEIVDKQTVLAYSDDSDSLIVRDFLNDPDSWLMLPMTSIKIERGLAGSH